MTATEIAHKPSRKFVHHVSDGCACAVCGSTARPLALHMLRGSYSRDEAAPKGFMVLSMTVEAMHGVFPVCDHCAPACPTCGLPVATKPVLKFQKSAKATRDSGVCPEHGDDNFSARLKAIFARTLKIGRGKKS